MLGNRSFPNVTTPLPNHASASSCTIEAANESTIVGMVFAYCVLFLAAMTGNALIIHIIRTNKGLKHIPFNHIILNLAVSDTVYAALVVPLIISYLFVSVKWFSGAFGLFLCKTAQFCVVASLLSTILTLTVISAERYWGILHAMKSPLSLKAVRRLIGVIWVISSLLASPQLYAFTTISDDVGNYYCVRQWSANIHIDMRISKIINVSTFVISYAMPLSTMAVLYGGMILHLWKRIPPGEDNDCNRKKARRQGRRVVIMLVTVVTAFAVCWFPVHVCHYLTSFDFDAYACLPTVVKLVLYWLAHANSAINPWLCIMFNNKFKDICLRMVKGLTRRKKRCQSLNMGMRNAVTLNTPLSQRKGLGDSSGSLFSLRKLLSSSLRTTPQSVRRSYCLQDTPQSTPQSLRRTNCAQDSPKSTPQTFRRLLIMQNSPQSTPQAPRRGTHDVTGLKPNTCLSLLLPSCGPFSQRHAHELSPPISPLQQPQSCKLPFNYGTSF